MSDEKKKGSVGKIIAGLVIGGAIGSVLGLAFAPQKGKKTRKVIREKTDGAIKVGQKILEEYQRGQNKK